MASQRPACVAAAVLVLACLAATATAQNSATNSTAQYTEINTSIILVGPEDYIPNGNAYGNASRCVDMVDKAAQLVNSRLMFVPTLFWVGVSTNTSDPNAITNVTYYCYNRTYPASGLPPSTCPQVRVVFDSLGAMNLGRSDAATQTDIALFQTGMQDCFEAAVAKGLNIAIAPHLDDGLGLGAWRNSLNMDPYQVYGNWSYNDIMLYPLAAALNNAITNTTKVWFAMQGEMSATVWKYPGSYVTLLADLRTRVTYSQPNSTASNIQIGVSTNFNKLCGCVLLDLVDPSQYLNLFGAAIAPLLPTFDLHNLTLLYNLTDFIGISSYPSLTPNFTTELLESATYQFANESSYFGINLTNLIFDQGKELFWNEYGVGGGSNQDGEVPAANATQAAATPFFGVFGNYNSTLDPWQEFEPETVYVDTRQYLHYFYNQTLLYLTNAVQYDYKVSGVFIWNQVSWDIQAIYPASTTTGPDGGSYYDPVIVPEINAHNAIAISQAAGKPANSTPVATSG